jgi:hypothetical protein
MTVYMKLTADVFQSNGIGTDPKTIII